ncbi:MAG: hypothetical protein HYZ52_00285 [Candidatus Omnitrophica bacterium]|nr:hypothetical protein [Candidatus Omnitrophota bacterium]
MTKPIRLSRHAEMQLDRRGADEDEIINAVRQSKWENADLGRLQCRKDFPYNNQNWNGKHYKTKQVRPIFIEAPNEIVIVTVYVYYF